VFDQLRSAARVAQGGLVIHSIGPDANIADLIAWDETELTIKYISDERLIIVQSPVKKGDRLLAWDVIITDANSAISDIEAGGYRMDILQDKRAHEVTRGNGEIISYMGCEAFDGTMVISAHESDIFGTVQKLTANINIRYFLVLVVMFLIIQFFIVRYIRGFIKTQQELKAAAELREKERNLLTVEMNKGFLLLKVHDNSTAAPELYEIVEANRTFESMIHQQVQRLIGKNLSRIETLKQIQLEQIINEIAHNGSDEPTAFYIKELNCWWQLSAYSPREGYLAVICEDITEKINTEAKLKDSEELMRMTLDVTGEGVWDWRLEEDIIYHNRRWCELLGLDESYIKGRLEEFAFHLHPEDREKVIALINEAVETEGEYFSEHRMVRKDSSVIWVEDRGAVVKRTEGKAQRMIGSMSDITQRKKAQLDLFLEKELFQSTLLSVGDGIISTDVNGRIRVLNPAAELLTGWNQEEAISRDVGEVLKMVDNKTGESIYWKNEDLYENQMQNETDTGVQLISLSGEKLMILYRIAPIHLPGGEITGYVIVFRDVTELLEKQQKIEYLSFHDELTGLYNRRYMEDSMLRLNTARNLPYTIVMLDLNNLKLMNDIFGHEMGDRLLKSAADFLRSTFRADDIICRIGGDEFCILMPKTTMEAAETIKQRILNESPRWLVGPLWLSIAVGYAIKTENTQKIEDVFHEADLNMYQNKQECRSQVKSRTIDSFLQENYTKLSIEKEHDYQVSILASALYEKLGKTQTEVSDFRKAVQVHDIGKITIPDEVINKMEQLTAEDWETVNRH